MEKIQEVLTVEQCLQSLLSVVNVFVRPSPALRWFTGAAMVDSVFDALGHVHIYEIAERSAYFQYDEYWCPCAIHVPVYDGTTLELFKLVYRNE